MNKRNRPQDWIERMAAGLLLLALVLGCGVITQVTADSPAAAIALHSRATR